MRMPRATIALTLAVAVAGCSDIGLRHLDAPGQGPDEFSVMPVKPLTQPKDYAFLPAPTPGAENLTDPDPKGDAVAALGGSATALKPTAGIPSSDAALVTASSRYGVAPDTRQALAAEDEAFRKRQSRWTRLRLFKVDRYAEVYKRDAIDPGRQAEVLRSQGYETPSSPPDE